MRGFQYKEKEGVEMILEKSYDNASFTLSEDTKTRGFTVVLIVNNTTNFLSQDSVFLKVNEISVQNELIHFLIYSKTPH